MKVPMTLLNEFWMKLLAYCTGVRQFYEFVDLGVEQFQAIHAIAARESKIYKKNNFAAKASLQTARVLKSNQQTAKHSWNSFQSEYVCRT